MALALAYNIANAGWDLNDQANRYIAWWKHGDYSVNGTCFDIGITTRSALSRFQKTKERQNFGRSIRTRGWKRLDHASGPRADSVRESVSGSVG